MVLDAVDITKVDDLLDVVNQIVGTPDISTSSLLRIPLRRGDDSVGDVLVSPSAWGGNANVAVIVRRGKSENALVMHIPVSAIPEQDERQTKRDRGVIEGIVVASSVAAGVMTTAALSFTGPMAAAAGVMAASCTKGEIEDVVRRAAPGVAERAGRRSGTFYPASNWIGLFRRERDSIQVFGRLAEGERRGVVLCDAHQWKGGVYISGDVSTSIPDVRFFVRLCSTPFICHCPATGEVWYIGKYGTIAGAGHQVRGKRVDAIEVGGVAERVTGEDKDGAGAPDSGK